MAVLDGSDLVLVDTPHGRIRVRDTGGSGAPVLLVHSLLVDPDLYATVVPLLSIRGYRCLIPELGGHRLPLDHGADLAPTGLARLLVEVLDELGIDRVHVVGVDTCGALTQLMMASHRDRLGSVIVTACDAYEDFPPRSAVGRLFTPMFSRPVLAVAAQALRLSAARRLRLLRPITHRGVDDATLLRWTTPLRDPRIRRDVRTAFRAMNPRYTVAAAEANRDFPRPVLIAWGDDDRLFRRHLADRLVRGLPNARLVTLSDCAAFASLDQPEQLTELVDQHLSHGMSTVVVAPPT